MLFISLNKYSFTERLTYGRPRGQAINNEAPSLPSWSLWSDGGYRQVKDQNAGWKKATVEGSQGGTETLDRVPHPKSGFSSFTLNLVFKTEG